MEKSKPSFRPLLNEKTVAIANHRRGSSYRISEEDSRYREPGSSQILNRSFVDLSSANPEFLGNDSFADRRAITPTRVKPHQKSSTAETMIHEVDYAPSMDFLLRKITPK